MTRKHALIAILGGICAVMTGKARSEEDQKVSGFTYTDNKTSLTIPKGALSFNLDNFTEFRFSVGDQTVTLTPAEMMTALLEK